jgi:hypothetical protein
MNFDIKYKSNHIIFSQFDNIMKGGFLKLKDNKVIELWQNPYFSDNFVNFYLFVNEFLRGRISNQLEKKFLKLFKLNTESEFIDFLIYFVNKLTNIIYKNVSTKTKYFYRGEIRKEFNHNIGDTIFYPTFQSVTKSISTAHNFTFTDVQIKLLFVIEIPKGFHYKKLDTKLTIYDKKTNITKFFDEKEYLIMPNSYYIIIDKFIIYKNIHIIKLVMVHQDYHTITNDDFYIYKNISANINDYKNFNTDLLTNFIKLSKEHEKNVLYLNTNIFEDFVINYVFYDILKMPAMNNMFKLDMQQIHYELSKLDDSNIKEIYENIKNLGVGYYDFELKEIDKYKSKIMAIDFILKTNFNLIKKLTVFCGYKNYTDTYSVPKFIKFLKKQKLNEEFTYSKILQTETSLDYYLYNSIFNHDYPVYNIKKDNQTELLYYKYLIQFNLKNTKICVNNLHDYETDDFIILIPNFKMKIINIQNISNRFGMNCEYFTIDVSSNYLI